MGVVGRSRPTDPGVGHILGYSTAFPTQPDAARVADLVAKWRSIEQTEYTRLSRITNKAIS